MGILPTEGILKIANWEKCIHNLYYGIEFKGPILTIFLKK